MSGAEIAQKGPYVEETDAGEYYWCSCGRSEDQPFCDGGHHGTAFTPLAHTVAQTKTLAWCGCKQTKNPPFCDGSHNAL
ncbi:MAG TPA: cytochrome C551 [Gammaproteobacteria bacterium]|nr:CDGSH iron-sulfur domain-containing protein [Pseudomonadota bacterium]HCZ48639.1 cytochrome C551 [Gammaproteobacteria bacterium]MCH78077.1 cytochrome C551 [Gammaproteobacteria bacterium]